MSTETGSQISRGDSAYIMMTCVWMLLMTIPGLALYFGGMVRSQIVMVAGMQGLTITCIISFLWLCVGYSLCFAPSSGRGGNGFIGDASRMWLMGLEKQSTHCLSPTIPESVFCVRQLMFAILTPALICGGFAHRMKYKSMALFMCLWHLFVYCPIAHANWHPNGELMSTFINYHINILFRVLKETRRHRFCWRYHSLMTFMYDFFSSLI